MIRSMTAYANTESATAQGWLACEVRAVNSRFLEVGVRLPDELRALEPQVRERIGARLARGKVDASFRYRPPPVATDLLLDERTAAQLAATAEALKARFPQLATDFAGLLDWPGLLVKPELDQAGLTQAALGLLDRTLDEFIAGRAREGAKLAAALVDRLDGIERIVATALRHRDAGFRTLKLKVGAGGDDVAAMQAVRDAVGSDLVLRADANQGWTPPEAIDVIRAWEDRGLAVELIEQPVHRDDLDGLAFVTAHVDTPVLADESVWTTRDVREVLARNAADLVNIKLAKTGGIREALAVRDAAASAGIRCIVGCMMESQVGIAAAAAVAAAVDAGAASTIAHDLDAGLWMRESPVAGGIRYDGETVHLADAPGLGITGLR